MGAAWDGGKGGGGGLRHRLTGKQATQHGNRAVSLYFDGVA